MAATSSTLESKVPLEASVTSITTSSSDAADSVKTTTPMSAAERLFAVVELAEIILPDDSLTPNTLFVLQRVNRTFQWTIQGSAGLRRKMWLEIDPQTPSDGATKYHQFVTSQAEFVELATGRVILAKHDTFRFPGGNTSGPFKALDMSFLQGLYGNCLQLTVRRPPNGEPIKVPKVPLAESWKDIAIANVPLRTTHHTFRKYENPRYDSTHMQGVRTFGDLYHATEDFGSYHDSLWLRPAW